MIIYNNTIKEREITTAGKIHIVINYKCLIVCEYSNDVNIG